MQRITKSLSLLLALTILAACGTSEQGRADGVGAMGATIAETARSASALTEQDEEAQEEPVIFMGSVLEVEKDALLLQRAGYQVRVPTNGPNLDAASADYIPVAQTGDVVEVGYTGVVSETDPMEPEGVFYIHLYSAVVPEPDLPEDIVQKLSSYPETYQEMLEETDVVIAQQGELQNGELWVDFYYNVQTAEPCEVVVSQASVEGDPILDYMRYDGTEFLWVRDRSRDHFAASPYYSINTYAYWQWLEYGEYNVFTLTDQIFDGKQEYEEYLNGEHEKYPALILWVTPSELSRY